jgi:hypothetical protein
VELPQLHQLLVVVVLLLLMMAQPAAIAVEEVQRCDVGDAGLSSTVVASAREHTGRQGTKVRARQASQEHKGPTYKQKYKYCYKRPTEKSTSIAIRGQRIKVHAFGCNGSRSW